MKAIKLFLISNMYPSKVNPGFGVFVKNFKVNQEERGVQFPYVSVINQKAKGIVNKFEIYFKHYINIFKNFFKKDYDIIYIHFISHNAPIFLFLLTFFKKKNQLLLTYMARI